MDGRAEFGAKYFRSLQKFLPSSNRAEGLNYTKLALLNVVNSFDRSRGVKLGEFEVQLQRIKSRFSDELLYYIQSWLPKSTQESTTVTTLSLVLVTKKGAKIYYCYFFRLGDQKSSKNLLLILFYKLASKKYTKIYYSYFFQLGDEKRRKKSTTVIL